MVVICNIYKNVSNLLPHFFQHYLKYGVKDFIFGVHSGRDNPAWQEIKNLAPKSTTTFLVESYRGPICGTKEGETVNRLRMMSPCQWVIPTDLDEFHLPCNFPTFTAMAEACVAENADYVHSTFLDCTTSDGTIPPSIDPAIPITEQFPKHTNITKDLLGGADIKVCMSRKHIPLTEGHHHVGSARTFDNSIKRFSKRAITNHYKWFGNLLAKEEEKYLSYKEKGYDYCSENLKLLEHLRSHGGKLIV